MFNPLLFILAQLFAFQVLYQCRNTNGILPIDYKESPCSCSGVECYYGYFCNEDHNGCTHEQTSIFDPAYISVEGRFSYSSLYINDMKNNAVIALNPVFETVFTLKPAHRHLTEVGNGTYFTTYTTNTSNIRNSMIWVQDNIVSLRNSTDGSIIKKTLIRSLDDHELRLGHHPLELIGIKWIHADGDETNFSPVAINNNAIVIMDFSIDPVRETIIKVGKDFNSTYDNGRLSTFRDWMHGNSAGVDIHGNYYMNGRHGSFLVVYDRVTLDKLYTISTEFRSDYTFLDPLDKFYCAHDTHQLPNGNWIFYDNGNMRPEEEGGEYTRCIEYEVDHSRKTVRKVWEWRIDRFCYYTGSCRRLENGHTLIGFFNCVPLGSTYPYDPHLHENYIVEIDDMNNVVGKANLGYARNQTLYRATPSMYFNAEEEENEGKTPSELILSDATTVTPQDGIYKSNLMEMEMIGIVVTIIIMIILLLLVLCVYSFCVNDDKIYQEENVSLDDNRVEI